MIISVVGAIGAGKTQQIRDLASLLTEQGKRVRTVLEPVEKWKRSGLLQSFYSDPERYAYLFQTTVFNDLVDGMEKALQAWPDVILAERSMECALIFWGLQIKTPQENESYMGIWGKWTKLIPEPSLYVYLDTDNVELLMERIQQRGREAETALPREYEEKLVNAHRAKYTKERFGRRILILPAENATQDNTAEIIKKLQTL